ncbi:MAG: hypothetical protein ABIU87_02620 [Ornithinibacter sp.]
MKAFRVLLATAALAAVALVAPAASQAESLVIQLPTNSTLHWQWGG